MHRHCRLRGMVSYLAVILVSLVTPLEVAQTGIFWLSLQLSLDFLKSPPGNRLEALSGDKVGQHSIRINLQWRVCFVWTALGPTDIEICDHH